MKLVEILRAGKANIETKGHAKGDDVWAANQSRGCCVITALPHTKRYSTERGQGVIITDRTDALSLFRRANDISDQQAVGDWSDEHTKEEVLAAFDKAIALAQQETP